ncbi:MAG TPA: alpha-amylase family glycosyl hydrolase [Anaerolineales bacterium]|nr:alpha-amylase family glycosyl hydrolase [Anaerolineales bacterium]
MEFHVSKPARDRYQFDLSVYNLRGNVIFANFYAARVFADRMNSKRDLARFPEQAVTPGSVNAMGLIDEILHLIIQQYRQEVNPGIFSEAVSWLEAGFGPESLRKTLLLFTEQFPPVGVYRRDLSPAEYLRGSVDGIPNLESTLEELIALWLANNNPAFSPFLELFDDSALRAQTPYLDLVKSLDGYFETQPSYGPGSMSLLDLLQTPALTSPHSLEGQLAFLLEKWGHLLPAYIFRILSSLDLIKEEEKAVFAGSGPSLVPDFRGLELEAERFSPDLDWMPAVVLMAKNVFVWLHQLSKAYSRPIQRLDEIPDEELDKLQSYGITGLWLIGLWERSPASRMIKHLMGNSEAQASAYSLYSYSIASALGGEDAYRQFQWRAGERGIRLASDMVPNHMGIDSPWVCEQPDWFISLDRSPFPAYSFGGPDLSSDSRVGIFLEDHYFDRSDAAVVFRRHDRANGTDRFIYHGNDGTSTPWNDTAQINFLHPEAREAVIQTILGVARRFPIIRFDAAMTLAKRHFQRLWFPEAGTGGAIPSRAGTGLTKAQFDQLMPVEFWREVVDRVAAEVPDTLLLAEAFWLMEGYFVRTLGMHRVYNSAFMNMMRDEENSNYRSVMKNTLQFDPDILKRFVNFMNNPDEKTAVDQFGKGDKYFGICLMMSTLPGLPMFGHGQIEGFTEKYGMEFQKPSWEESPDPHLVSRHGREIFPLLHRRKLFAEVGNFLLYDFVTDFGYTNEDVFAYSNRMGDERALVVYHNRYAETSGTIRKSVAFADKSGAGDGKSLTQKTLLDGLGLSGEPEMYCVFRDHLTDLEYLRSSQSLANHGLLLSLPAYKAHVFLDIREIRDENGIYAELERFLAGRGVPSIEDAKREVLLQPIHRPLREVFNPEFFWSVVDAGRNKDGVPDGGGASMVDQKIRILFEQVSGYAGGIADPVEIANSVVREVESLQEMIEESASAIGEDDQTEDRDPAVSPRLDGPHRYLLLAWIVTHALGKVVSTTDYQGISRAWIDEWMLGKLVEQTLQGLDGADMDLTKSVMVLKGLVGRQNWKEELEGAENQSYALFKLLVEDRDTAFNLGVNRYHDVLWIRQEDLDNFLDWLILLDQLQQAATGDETGPGGEGLEAESILEKIRLTASEEGYQVESILSALSGLGSGESGFQTDRFQGVEKN